MASSKVEECMICGELPCVCFVKIKAPPKPRARKTLVPKTPELAVTPSPPARGKSPFAAMKAAAAAAPPPHIQPEQEVKRHVIAVDEQEALFAAAVRALGDMLAPHEQERYQAILTSEPTIDEKRIVWKARRRVENS